MLLIAPVSVNCLFLPFLYMENALFYRCAWHVKRHPLRKLAHAVYRDFIFSDVKIQTFHQKIIAIFLIFAQNIDCGYEYPQSMFWSIKKKKGYTPVNPNFAI